MRKTDLTGRRFGRLLVLGEGESVRDSEGSLRLRWQCRCDCGNTVSANGKLLVNGHTQSCGCLFAELRSQGNTTHGMAGTPTYRTWQHMIERCTDPKDRGFANYGGRGITVCDRWLESFENFLADMGEKPPGLSIERSKNDEGYEPGNCKWATAAEQSRNKRTNRPLTFAGRTQLLTDWANEVRLPVPTLHWRIERGWTIEAALTTPVRSTTRSRARLVMEATDVVTE